MNLISKSFLIGLIISILSNSCTIEKRVHRKGFHFEWKHQNNSATFTKYSSKINTTNKEEEKRLVEMRNEDNLSLSSMKNNSPSKEIQAYLENKQFDEKTIILHKSNRFKFENSVFTKKLKRLRTKSTNSSLNPFAKADHQRMTGVLMLVAALLLFGLGYVFFLYLGAFGLILFWIFGIGSAIIFLLGLLYTIFG